MSKIVPNLSWTDEEISILIQFYGKLNSKLMTEKFVNRTYLALPCKANMLGLTKQRIHYNLAMTKNDAYFLGWVASDGNLSKSKRQSYAIGIGLSSKDDYILYALKDHLKIGNIYHRTSYVTRPDNSIRTDKITTLIIYNKYLFDQIKTIGICENKSRSIPWITLEKHLYKDFIRGVFDGDGCISWHNCRKTRKGPGSWRACFTSGSKQFLLGLHSFLKSENVVCGGSISKSGVNCFNLEFGKKDTNSFGEWLYDIDSMKLNRKYEKFQKSINGISGEKDVI